MALRNAVPLKFKPRGVSDTFDGMNSIPGAMSSLSNLIPDPSTPDAFQCRPAVSLLVNFTTSGFSSPGAVSHMIVMNGRVYGLVASARNAGKDEPFSFNIGTGLFDTVTGITAANSPTTQATTGDWTPPTAAVMGNYVVFTHPGFNVGSGYYFGWFDITNPAAPTWTAGNTATNGLASLPTNVELFSNRLYFSAGNVLPYTDALTLTRSSASQYLTAGDISPITALSLFTLSTTNQGILQGLLVFKGNTVFQVTGDAALSTLSINSLNTAAGTLAQRSVAPTPSGVVFLAPDGIRVVQADGTVSEPDADLRLPFINALYPSRASGSYNQNVYQICTQNGGKNGSPWESYWFDLGREIWTGPHTFQHDVAAPYMDRFILASHINPGKLYTSYTTQVSGVGFTEVGTPLAWTFATAPIGEDDSLSVNTVNDSTINMAFSASSQAVTLTASDTRNGVVGSAVIPAPGGATIWGSFTWGASVWAGPQTGITPHFIPWSAPLVFTKAIFQANGVSSLGFKISNMRFLLQPSGYLPPV